MPMVCGKAVPVNYSNGNGSGGIRTISYASGWARPPLHSAAEHADRPIARSVAADDADRQNGVATARWSATSLPRSFDW